LIKKIDLARRPDLTVPFSLLRLNSFKMSTTLLQRAIQEHTPEDCCKSCRAHNTFLHVAVIIKRGKVLAVAQNRVGSRSRGSGYSSQTIHAEKAVVKKLGDISKLRDATLCVWRVSAISVLPSKPCSECHLFLHKCMKEYGLRSVMYTDTVMPL
jgi:hypothetical protein